MTKFRNADELIVVLAAKGYTAAQIVNSLAASLGYMENSKPKSAIVKGIYRSAHSKALMTASKAYVEAGPGGLPCDARCENATVEECSCLCSGVNHGVNNMKGILTHSHAA